MFKSVAMSSLAIALGVAAWLLPMRGEQATAQSGPLHILVVEYDIVPAERQVVRSPDVLILEGLNVLQTGPAVPGREGQPYVSDFFDFSVYVDADEDDVERWYVDRFLRLRETVFRDPSSYFRRYGDLDRAAAGTSSGRTPVSLSAAE